ncbi:hypothetical protein BDW59DRAFT_139689 [Aspergillus cavernicola]|uniref:DUF7924 domain-containing protein n=1 Tax=Aspergillus cavernicola TaxID=176166 RepID=A0ABR4IZ04_9EURO
MVSAQEVEQIQREGGYRLPVPQPDHAVGFSGFAFTEDQQRKLSPFFAPDSTFFKATSNMFFPFLTAEVKRRNLSLQGAERQNAHSMAVAMRGVVELFKLTNRQRELHCKTLGFSISYNHREVNINAHYPVIKEKRDKRDEKVIYTYSKLCAFDMRSQRDEWVAHRFVMAVYNNWVPYHFKLLCSAIDGLSGANLSVSHVSWPPQAEAGAQEAEARRREAERQEDERLKDEMQEAEVRNAEARNAEIQEAERQEAEGLVVPESLAEIPESVAEIPESVVELPESQNAEELAVPETVE